MEGIWLRFLSFQLNIMLLWLPRRWDCVSTELQHQERHGSEHYQGQKCCIFLASPSGAIPDFHSASASCLQSPPRSALTAQGYGSAYVPTQGRSDSLAGSPRTDTMSLSGSRREY